MKYVDTYTKQRIGFDFYCDVAQNIVKARKDRGWTAEELAKRSGLKPSLMYQLEAVKVRVELDMLQKISAALNVSIDWLIGAEIIYGGQDCLFLCWSEAFPALKLYQKATSIRMAYLVHTDYMKKGGVDPFLDRRDRMFVKLVGLPVSEAELQAGYKSRTDEALPLEKCDDE